MILAIVGSTCLAGNAAARLLVDEIVDRNLDDPFNLPLVVCSGAARGVDTFAAEAAVARGARRLATAELHDIEAQAGDLWLLELPPVCRQGDPPPADHRCSFRACYAPRDRQIAETCDRLVRVAGQCTTTYGSGRTRDIAAQLGKPTQEFVVPMTDSDVAKLARRACRDLLTRTGLFPGQDALGAVRTALGRHRLLDEVRVAEDAGAVTVWRREGAAERFLCRVELT